MDSQSQSLWETHVMVDFISVQDSRLSSYFANETHFTMDLKKNGQELCESISRSLLDQDQEE